MASLMLLGFSAMLEKLVRALKGEYKGCLRLEDYSRGLDTLKESTMITGRAPESPDPSRLRIYHFWGENPYLRKLSGGQERPKPVCWGNKCAGWLTSLDHEI